MSENMELEVCPEKGKITLDAGFLREQASEAVKTFFTPLVGLYAAAMGRRVVVRRINRRAKRVA